MALAPFIRTSQTAVRAVVEEAAADSTRVTQTLVRAVTQLPAENMRVSQGAIRAVTDHGNTLRSSQALVRAIIKGRVFDPRVRAWTFTLDGHDFYVLRLGNTETLIYDVATGQWTVWGSFDQDLWKAYNGFNWIGGRALGESYGSDVVVTDDANGSLYFLAPEHTTDDDAVSGADLPRPFTRKVTGQFVIRSGYDYVPCFGVQVYGSIGSEAGTVTLSISDDRGFTYYDVGNRSIVAGDYDFRLTWQSLGSMRSPGRLFTLTDTGAMQRVDGIEMEMPADGA